MFSKNYFEKQVVVVEPVKKQSKRSFSFSSFKVLKNVIEKFIRKNIHIKKPRKFFAIDIDARLKNYLEENFEIKKK